MIKNILSIDVEEYFQVSNFANIVKKDEWDKCEKRVEIGLDKVLSILADNHVKATFFVLGWVAERFPRIIERIARENHEVASHGYSHELVYNQSKEEFREDLLKSKKILEDIIKEPVVGYRAPSYSITKKSMWAFDVLIEEGFRYDSSIFPIHHDKGGLPHAERFLHKIYRNGKSIIEIPISTIKLFNQNMPFSGGGYFRLFPYCVIKEAIKNINKQGNPVVVYLHPWEFDPEQPKINGKFLDKFRHYVNINKTEKKLKSLINDFEFGKIKEII